MKKSLSIILSLVMIITALSALPFSANAFMDQTLRVNNSVELTASKPCYMNGAAEACAYRDDANVYYDDENQVLTLNNYNGSDINYDYSEDVAVNLVGANTIVTNECAIRCDGCALTITSESSGTLNITSDKNSRVIGLNNFDESRPKLLNPITISGSAKVNINFSSTNAATPGVYCKDSLYILDSADLSIKVTNDNASDIPFAAVIVNAFEVNTAGTVLIEAGKPGTKVYALDVESISIKKAASFTLKASGELYENNNNFGMTYTALSCAVSIEYLYCNYYDENGYAVFTATPKNPITYTVTYHANGGSGTMANETFEAGTKLFLPECTFTPPGGKVFKCWSIDGIEKNAGSKITVNKNLQVLAIWQDSEQHIHSYSFLKNDNTNHWYECSCGAKSEVQAHVYDNDSDAICNICGYERALQPQPPATYTVTYNANGGSGTMTPETGLTAGIKMYLPECTFTPPSGKKFKCWSIDGIEKNAGSKITVDKNIEVIAIWADAESSHTHNYDTRKFNSTQHWYECSCGAKDEIEAHDYIQTVTLATLSKNGVIKKRCSGCGYTPADTVIYMPKTFTLSATSYVYSGGEKKPTVTVKDSKGKVIAKSNYRVTYKDNKNVGTATVSVIFNGEKYYGTKKLTFKINPTGTSISKVSSPAKGQLKATWKKQATQTTGYEIQLATDSKFTKDVKKVTVSSNKTTSKLIKDLKGGKKYYVRIRTYKTVNKTKYYSDWSTSKTVTVKK